MAIFKRGRFYWFEFVYDGRRIQKSTKQGDKETAKALMAAERSRLARVDGGLESPESKQREQIDLTIGELLDHLEADYGRRGILTSRVRSNLTKAREAFPLTRKAKDLTSAHVEAYIEKRQRAGRAPATINRAVGTVALAFKKSKVAGPEFRHLSEEGNARKGFFEAEDLRRLLEHLPTGLQDFCRFAYITSWRKGEIASLRWSDVEGDLVRLRGDNAKNGQSRSVVLTPELAAIIERRRQARLSKGVLTEFVFHRGGRPFEEFRKSWASACVAAGLGKYICPKCQSEGLERACKECRVVGKYVGRIFHDFRRSGVRNMIRSGVPQSIAMKISGHVTASMFRRYDIGSEADVREAMLRVEAYNRGQAEKVVSMSGK